jgi:hypothetical protein
MMRAAFLRTAIVVAVLSACAKGVADPICDRCGEMRIRTAYTEYSPRSVIGFTITNRTSGPLRYDWCSIGAVGRSITSDPFLTVYRPDRRCGPGAGLAQVLANMRVLAAGASVSDSVTLFTGAFQGQYEIQLWLVDIGGALEPGNPVISNFFDVYPSAPH